MASTMAFTSFNQQCINFVWVRSSSKPVMQAPFKMKVIGTYFKQSCLDTFWMHLRILWLALCNIRACCTYIVDDMSLIPALKFLGNRVVYCTQNRNSSSPMDKIIGNIFLWNADLILIPTESKRLRFKKISVGDPSDALFGVKAIIQLLDKDNVKRIYNVHIESETDRGRELAIIKEHESGIQEVENKRVEKSFEKQESTKSVNGIESAVEILVNIDTQMKNVDGACVEVNSENIIQEVTAKLNTEKTENPLADENDTNANQGATESSGEYSFRLNEFLENQEYFFATF